MSRKVLRATHGSLDRPLRIAGFEIPCYVLEDGRRVLAQRGMVNALGMSRGSSNSRGGDRLAKFVAGKALEPFIPKQLTTVTTEPILFRAPTGGSAAYGYEAMVLADICAAVVAAQKAGVLQKQQLHIAERCEILVHGFARVGIIALVDEATGYQAVRDRDELQKILEAYVNQEFLPWTKQFPDAFYKELFRLMGWRYSPLQVKRPILVGKLTNTLIYEKLPPGVLEELRRINPVTEKGYRRRRHHQYLTEDIGHPHLREHMTSIITLMRAASSWPGFKRLFSRVFPAQGDQLELDIEMEEAEDGNQLDERSHPPAE